MDWLGLSDQIWESILCNLSERNLLNTSETCKKINDLFSTSKRMIKLLCLKIENPPEANHIKSELAKKK